MSSVASSPIEGSFAPSIFAPRHPSSPVHIEDDVPADIDASFASGMSISHPVSPLLDAYSPMDISPAPTPLLLQVPRRPALATLQPKLDTGDYFNAKPIASSKATAATSGSLRMFGKEVSNMPHGSPTAKSSGKGLMLPPPVPSPGSRNARSRSALPLQWLDKSSNADKRRGGLFKPPPEWPSSLDVSPARSDAMELDRSSCPGSACSRVSADEAMSPPPAIMSTYGEPGDLSSLYETEGEPSPMPSKAVPNQILGFEPPSSSPPSSPTLTRKRKMEKYASTGGGGMLFRPARGTTVPSRRSHPYPRRPSINPFAAERDTVKPQPQPQSAFAILTHETERSSKDREETAPPAPAAPAPAMRRAFSMAGTPDLSSDDLDIGVDGSPIGINVQRAYARRNQARVVTRADGSPAFRPIRNKTEGDQPSTSLFPPHSQGVEPTSSPYGPGGLPGFGDNEADGKILPCHKVKEDGLMRISTDTLQAVLNGDFASQMHEYHIIDCRFDYEFKGGHITGAINLNSTEAIEEYFLGGGYGKSLPTPTRSGSRDETGSLKKTVIIFHCEFSAKRAPTFAKHLRSKDRAMNSHVYPKVHFPEVYILSGGYSAFYNTSPVHCEPRGYVGMLDPAHAASCSPSLGEFRAASRWQRTRSYTYGETGLQKPREALPFAAAAAALGKRKGLSTLQEDADASSGAEDAFGSLGDSPCPPSVSSRAAAAMAAPHRPKSLGRVTFERAVSFRQ